MTKKEEKELLERIEITATLLKNHAEGSEIDLSSLKAKDWFFVTGVKVLDKLVIELKGKENGKKENQLEQK